MKVARAQATALHFRSELPVDARTLYRSVLLPANLLREMRPWIVMAGLPSLARDQMYTDVPFGQMVASCPIRFLGVVPVDTWQLAFDELAPPDAPDGTPLRFVEASRTSMMKTWRHQRTVSPAPHDAARAILEDALTFETKRKAMQPLAAQFVRAFFRHRHRQLAKLWPTPENLRH